MQVVDLATTNRMSKTIHLLLEAPIATNPVDGFGID